MLSTAKNPSAGRIGSCPYTLASPGTCPRKSRTAHFISFKSTPPLFIAQSQASRRFWRFRPRLFRTLVMFPPFSRKTDAIVADPPRLAGRYGHDQSIRVRRSAYPFGAVPHPNVAGELATDRQF